MALQVTSRELVPPPDFDLFEHLPQGALLFARNGDGLIGAGEALRMTATGGERFASLAGQWREVCAAAAIDDRVRTAGSGLIAFGSLAFAEQSASESVLIVPRVIFGRRDGRAWLTTISAEGDAAPPDAATLLEPFDYPPATALRFSEGAHSGAAFMQAVVATTQRISSGDVAKVVLAREMVAEVPQGFDLRPHLARLGRRFGSCWTYSVAGTFGASPELLVRVAERQVSARVLAGTAGRGTEPSIDAAISQALASSGKNRREHAFAVDSLVAALTPFCQAITADEQPFSLALPNLWHLASDVQGVLRGEASSLDIAAALHPTAAVAGTPTAAALSEIRRLEPFDRGRYAGPVGWLGADGDGEWAIALRGGQLTADCITAYAGCGIVAGSDPVAELAETELKFQPVLGAFA